MEKCFEIFSYRCIFSREKWKWIGIMRKVFEKKWNERESYCYICCFCKCFKSFHLFLVLKHPSNRLTHFSLVVEHFSNWFESFFRCNKEFSLYSYLFLISVCWYFSIIMCGATYSTSEHFWLVSISRIAFLTRTTFSRLKWSFFSPIRLLSIAE